MSEIKRIFVSRGGYIDRYYVLYDNRKVFVIFLAALARASDKKAQKGIVSLFSANDILVKWKKSFKKISQEELALLLI